MRSDTDGAATTAVPEDLRVTPFDSLFEQRVFNRLIDRGYTVVPQFESMGYKIDLMVTGAKGRLAVECDGDFWHGPEQYEEDLARQRELERCGWKFFRIRESVFYADMPGTLKALWDTLDELDIRTADWIDPRFDEDEEPESDELATSDLTPAVEDSVSTVSAAGSVVDTAELPRQVAEPQSDAPRGRHAAPDDQVVGEGSAPTESGLEVTRVSADISAPTVAPEMSTPANTLAPYVAFTETLPPVQDTPLAVLVANVVRIVEVEGPMLGHRLHDAYRISYGGQRVGKELARQLNRAIELAVTRRQIVADNPLNQPGVKPRTFRLPSQPVVVQRELGPRTLGLVPPAELASHFAEFAETEDFSDEEMFREVLNVLGLKRLTEPARAVLSEVLSLVSAG